AARAVAGRGRGDPGALLHDQGRVVTILRRGVVRAALLGGLRDADVDAAARAVGVANVPRPVARTGDHQRADGYRRPRWLQPHPGQLPPAPQLLHPGTNGRIEPVDCVVQPVKQGMTWRRVIVARGTCSAKSPDPPSKLGGGTYGAMSAVVV